MAATDATFESRWNGGCFDIGIRMNVIIDEAPSTPRVEIVECKGLGHPDSICDALAERLSVALSQFYLEHAGTILHHNVDKALIRAGRASPRFGGGEVSEPIDVYFAGRATTEVHGRPVPVEQIALDVARDWFREHLHALDPDRHVRVHCLVRRGSTELTELFARAPSSGAARLANDTSIGVGYAPLSALERLTLELEEHFNSRAFVAEHPAHGEDVKWMAVRSGDRVRFTVARAFVGRYLENISAYAAATKSLGEEIESFARSRGVLAEVRVNAADDLAAESVYLTVTGTSAESGDDGEVGRGNRANGLITPLRPMSLEALAGKNPVTHVGKLYNVTARLIAESIVAATPAIAAATCALVSEIGRRIDEPQTVYVGLRTDHGYAPTDFTDLVREVASRHLSAIANQWQRILEGQVRLF